MANLLNEELSTLRDHLSQIFNRPVKDLDLSARDDLRRVIRAELEDGEVLNVHTTAPGVPAGILQSQVATLDYLRDRSSIPVPRILHTSYSGGDGGARPFIVIERSKGSSLDAVWPSMEPFQQDLVIGQIARWMMELFTHTFDKIGSLYPIEGEPAAVKMGPVTQPLFYIEGRSEYPLDRGPFSSAKDYISGCAQRELDSSRFMFSQDTSKEYQMRLQEEKDNVERSMHLFEQLIQTCPGLDSGDPDMAPFTLDVHNLPMRNIIVDSEDYARIVSVEFVPLTTLPRWCCARMPSWLSPSASEQSEGKDKARWTEKFRETVVSVEGYHSLFLRALESEDTRHALLDVCKFNAFADSFLLMPTLQSIVATLPGEEDLEGLEALLDPSTLEGRVARIALTTRGPGVMSLAMPMNEPSNEPIEVVTPPTGSYQDYTRIDPAHFGSPRKSEKEASPMKEPPPAPTADLTPADFDEVVKPLGKELESAALTGATSDPFLQEPVEDNEEPFQEPPSQRDEPQKDSDIYMEE